ncbi:hypothetical protein PNH38_16925 [Anoxybacillus rupiensis]|uniref:Uncharacterized protein n=1 Tax=Anoxybacteroides rupiense TaxID=311460 RepID=A0ABT5W877_9BACL|nr:MULTISPECIES: hypothetical protein [Anoxybacillus]MBS2771884.1 hypothetical protein [Anoxybacillus rupiensis]MDE8565530.1 hypothetical protein [Anoxybacillus rupiensis]QHC02814.1 hypothetical protein GRQ40_01550 [Anoxybacillus sp. PDR2]
MGRMKIRMFFLILFDRLKARVVNLEKDRRTIGGIRDFKKRLKFGGKLKKESFLDLSNIVLVK